MKIRIKYCGSCNPDYDQEELVKEIKKNYNAEYDDIESGEHISDEIVLLVNGCQRRCLKKEDIKTPANKILDVADYLEIFNKENTAKKLSKKIIDDLNNISGKD